MMTHPSDVTAPAPSQPIAGRAPTDDVNSIDRRPISARPTRPELNIKCKQKLLIDSAGV